MRAREERRRRKIEKAIRRLEKSSQQPKPISEFEIPLNLRDALEWDIFSTFISLNFIFLSFSWILSSGKIKIPQQTEQELEERVLFRKEYSQFKMKQHQKTVKLIDKLLKCKEKELKELRNQSEDLYQEAIQVCFINNMYNLS